MAFNFEKNLEHQTKAINAMVGVFEGLHIHPPTGLQRQYINPHIDKTLWSYYHNIHTIRNHHGVLEWTIQKYSEIIDIMMETGTGKTYTYTKTMFELNKMYGIFKFVIVVPTVPIKAWTINFLQSASSRDHFKEQYGKTIKLHIVESQKSSKSKKSHFPSSVQWFVRAWSFEKNHIQVLIINRGMLNASSMQKVYDTTLFDTHATPFDALAATKPFIIIDEPHKFKDANKTRKNIQTIQAQYILRYGATFPETETKKIDSMWKKIKVVTKDYHNLIYTLTAVDAFNQNLVKWLIGHITEFDAGKNILVKLISTDGKQARFELQENINTTSASLSKTERSEKTKKSTYTLFKKDSLEKVHSAMDDLTIVWLNKTTVVLSNGIQLKKWDKLNPYSYAQRLQETMIQKTVRNHFVLEKKLLQQEVKIKPLTLFFIDNIEEYRGDEWYIKNIVEQYILMEAVALLETEISEFYRAYLLQTIEDITTTHGWYFSADTSDSSEKIEKEVEEILHDKDAMLSLTNTRRFIFSKRTLREWRDNPNVFQICKLRSSGSEISKLQEVWRGLRLPVNEYGNRVKDEQFYLHYFVDFTENEFVESLVNEINKKSWAISYEHKTDSLHERMIAQIVAKYDATYEELLQTLDDKNIINRANQFKEWGFEYIQRNYPMIFEWVNTNKIRKQSDTKKKIHIRSEKYAELKLLREKLNEKILLEYKIANEQDFQAIFVNFLTQCTIWLRSDVVREKRQTVAIENNQAVTHEEVSIDDSEISAIKTMSYDMFLKQLANSLRMNITTVHQSLILANLDINLYLNQTTIRLLQQKFNTYLMHNAIDAFGIWYEKITNSIHPTAFTNSNWHSKSHIPSSSVGVFSSHETVADTYLFDQLFYDSDLEYQNIKANIQEVVVFSKIPKNSIKIPIAWGKRYSPDFAYVLQYENGSKKLYFVVETKDTQSENLRNEEQQKIKHAELFFHDDIKITFKTQFNTNKIVDMIKEIRE